MHAQCGILSAKRVGIAPPHAPNHTLRLDWSRTHGYPKCTTYPGFLWPFCSSHTPACLSLLSPRVSSACPDQQVLFAGVCDESTGGSDGGALLATCREDRDVLAMDEYDQSFWLSNAAAADREPEAVHVRASCVLRNTQGGDSCRPLFRPPLPCASLRESGSSRSGNLCGERAAW